MKARLTLKVRAGAAATQFAHRYGDGWKLHVAAPPVGGKANAAIVRLLAAVARVPAANVRIVSGASAGLKVIEVAGVTPAELDRAILEAHGARQNSGRTPTGSN